MRPPNTHWIGGDYFYTLIKGKRILGQVINQDVSKWRWGWRLGATGPLKPCDNALAGKKAVKAKIAREALRLQARVKLVEL